MEVEISLAFLKNRLFGCLNLLLLSLCLFPTPVTAAEHPLVGPAFLPSEETVRPSEQWPGKPFRHDPADAEADLVVIVNQQFYDHLSASIAGFARQNGLQIVLKKGTCGLSAGAVLAKSAEIVSFCCPPGAVDRLPGLSFHTLGIYPIAILVHPDNPVRELSWAQVQKVFQGGISNWSELGGHDEEILPIIRLHCKNRPGHWRLLLDRADQFAVRAQEVGSIDDVYELVAEHSEAIGYEAADDYYARGTQWLKIDGMSPKNLDYLLRGAYPFYRVLNFALWDRPRHRQAKQIEELFDRLVAYVEKHGREIGLLPASELRAAGWQFDGDELIGAPARQE